ncbi:hypothetical protein [Aureimonas sp. AU12]|uniref:hypothetical protein n=1 Tax=Aureimonas sp. AU12 TaxID=1638161 RepID=UPI000A88202F|nr:hypothetical protein [Aureimonas sp. AU12]
MRVLPRLVLLASLAGLTACTTITPEERRGQDEARCAGYGFRRGTDAFAACLQRIDLARYADRRARLYDDTWYPGGVVPGSGYGRVW